MEKYLKRLEEELDSRDLDYNDKTLQQLSRCPESFEIVDAVDDDRLYMKFEWNGGLELNPERGVNLLSYSLKEFEESDFLEEIEEEIEEGARVAVKNLSEKIDIREERFDGRDQGNYHKSNLEKAMAESIYEIIVDGKSMSKIHSLSITPQRMLENIDYGGQ